MSALLTLSISLLLVNHWLLAAVKRDGIEDRRPPSTLLFGFAAGALAFTAPLTYFIDASLASFGAAPIAPVAAILGVSVAVQLTARYLASRVQLTESEASVNRRRVLLNCSVFSLTLLYAQWVESFAASLWWGLCMGLAFECALQVFARIDARLSRAPVPVPFRGPPIALLSAGFIALALFGLKGLF